MKVLVEADGGSRGNPGPAGYGAVVLDADHDAVLAERKEAIGRATNNVAEYRGLIAGLEAATELGAAEVAVSMDSKLIVEQMSGRWKVKHPDLIPLQRRAAELARWFRTGQLRVDPAGTQQPRRPAGERGHGRGRGHRQRHRRHRPKQPVQAEKAALSAPGWTGATGAPTRLLLLRHGQTELSIARRYSGRGNPALTEEGRRQADAAARYLGARGGVAAVVTSPLERACETATAAAKALGVDVRVDDDLIETDFGDWEGLTFAEAAQRDPELHRRWLQDTSVEPPGGESFDAAAHRVRRARTGSSPSTARRRFWWSPT